MQLYKLLKSTIVLQIIINIKWEEKFATRKRMKNLKKQFEVC